MNALKILDNMTDSENKEFFYFAGILARPITQSVLKYLSAPKCIRTDDIPITFLATKQQIISRLIDLEKFGIAKSEKAKTKDGYCKKYWLSEKGSDLVHKIMNL